MEERRQAAGRLDARIVALLAVPRQALADEGPQRRFACHGASPAKGRDRVIDREQRQLAAATGEQIGRGGGPAREDGRENRRGRLRQRIIQRGKGIGLRQLEEMQGQIVLQVTPQIDRTLEGPRRGGKRQEPVRIHRFEQDRDLGGCGHDHAGQKETGERIRHHHGGVRRKGFEQA